MVLAAITILVLARNLSFWSDEFEWLTFQNDFGLRGLITPHGSHLMATNRVIYEELPRLFGTSYLPFRLLAGVLLFACSALLFVLVRRRMGPVVALFPAIVLLFFGSAQDIVLSPLGIPFTLSIALGLAALAAAERGDRRGDLLTFVLISLAILSHTFGTIVAIGIGVHLLLEPERRRQIWVVAVPVALWVAWWLWARQFDQSVIATEDLLAVPLRMVDAAGAAIEGAVGIPPEFGNRSEALETGFGLLFDLVAIGAAAALAVRLRRGGGSWLWAYTAIALIFWAGIALADPEERDPATPRYLFFGGIMVVLILAEAFRGRTVPRRAVPWLLALFAASLVGNFVQLVYAVPGIEDEIAEVRSQIAVLELDRDAIEPDVRIKGLGPPAAQSLGASAGELAQFSDDVGPLGFSLDELRDQSEELRLGADFALIRALGVAAVAVPEQGGPKPGECTTFSPGEDGSTVFPLGFGANLIEMPEDSGDPGAVLLMGRFADVASVPVGLLAESEEVAVLLPADGAEADPWFGSASGVVRVCAVVS
jgi:hypothetical protein